LGLIARNEAVAKKIIELAMDGALDSDRLCEQALKGLHEQPQQRVDSVVASSLPCRPD
jgi:hypothetical protein